MEIKTLWWNSLKGRKEIQVPIDTERKIAIIRGHIEVPVVNCGDDTYTF